MSAFEVVTTAGQGYRTRSAASALKNDQSLMDTPQAVMVIGADLVKDIGSATSSDIVQYAGVNNQYRGESVALRGSRVGNAYIDDVTYNYPYSDNVMIDSYEVIMGPTQVFYPGASLAGVVLKSTKKPLPTFQASITASISQFGGRRLTYDFTGPIGKLGGGDLSYRLVGALQGGNQYFYNLIDDRFILSPTLQYKWRNTTVYVAYDYQHMIHAITGDSVLTPTGQLYVGNDRRNENLPPNSHDKFELFNLRSAWTQKFSDEWEMKFQAVDETGGYNGVDAYPSTVNWNNNTIGYQVVGDNVFYEAVTLQDDFIGKYTLFDVFPSQSAFGFNTLDRSSISKNRSAPTITIPLGDAATVNTVLLPAFFPQPANPGSRSVNFANNTYFMEQIDLIPKWLTAVGGFTFAKTENITDSNLTLSSPYPSTDQNSHALLHRMGLILHLNKHVMLYGMESTTFSGAVGLTYANLPLPPVLGKDDEVGFKTSFLDGRITSTFSIYKMALTNQAILAPYPALNPAGNNYYLPIGSTNYRGWNADFSMEVARGWQLIATAYSGTVHDQRGNTLPSTFENSWSMFTRYDFAAESLFKGLAIGAGAARVGGRWFNMGGMTLPGAAPLPVNSSGNSVFKIHEGTMTTAFINYRLNRHWQFAVNCENVLDQAFAAGAQGVGLVDPTDPRTFTFSATFKF